MTARPRPWRSALLEPAGKGVQNIPGGPDQHGAARDNGQRAPKAKGVEGMKIPQTWLFTTSDRVGYVECVRCDATVVEAGNGPAIEGIEAAEAEAEAP